ncbi:MULTISPECIES: hypothetical protein [unclassified Streptomyces]|uniref:hypothetical protein n=1 Tax=unclassified Streptomyces TaxID=2593676 RepID=UPI002255CCE9|nr:MULTISPECIES: hypothetical protein [unclassified Streptomyces]MCX5332226.1 hypothetical protein [Streptomyces sp. NBC_00140]MCX5361604.1 hypothetical protein [Streptomyces sp. NBC_00124]
MKIQERTGAGQGRSAAPAQPSVGDRLPTPPRERKPALAALAVLLILVGALGATMLVLQAGDRIEVVKVTEEIQAGESVTNSNVTSVMVAEDSSIHYIKWSLLDDLKKLKAVSTIPAGAVAVGEMFGDKVAASDGKTLVGLSLKAGQFPTGIKVGDTVAAYRVTEGGSATGNSSASTSGSDNSLLVGKAVVTATPGDKGDDELVGSTNSAYTLAVGSDEAAALAQAAANNEVVLVLVPSSN